MRIEIGVPSHNLTLRHQSVVDLASATQVWDPVQPKKVGRTAAWRSVGCRGASLLCVWGSNVRGTVHFGCRRHALRGPISGEADPSGVGEPCGAFRMQELRGQRSSCALRRRRLYLHKHDAVSSPLHPEGLQLYRDGEVAICSGLWAPTGVLGGPARNLGYSFPDHILGELLVLGVRWARTPRDYRA